jgi:aryl-alcohol dehydrogenase-like predicted oxidoreductase
MLSASSQLDLTQDMSICRLVNGMWQVSGAHGRIDLARALRNMFDYFDAGLTTWDLADHYGPAEDLIGMFRRELLSKRGRDTLVRVRAFTKWVPQPMRMTHRVVDQAINRSLQRMNTETLDLLQFHWWEYADPGYLDALHLLMGLKSEGKIRHLGLTNFDTAHLRTIVESGIEVVSNQVQFSLIDRRPEVQMIPYCRERGIWLLPYGTLCGSLMSEAYLNRPEPRRNELNTASLQKYKQMIDLWGGWGLFQELLHVLDGIAHKHGASIANVATRFILDRPMVAGVIIGARLGMTDHRDDNVRSFDLVLDAEDRAALDGILARSNDLFHSIGDCGDEYRR